MTFEEVLKKDFEIRNGRINERNSSFTGYELRKFGWGAPEYQIIGIGQYGEYSIKQDAYKDWYIYKGYSPVMQVYYLGGENWNSYR